MNELTAPTEPHVGEPDPTTACGLQPTRPAPTSERRSTERVPARFASLLAAGNVRAVLARLNARTRYRFTGLYRVEPPLLRSVELFDRENPSLRLAGDINTLEDTCCAIVAHSEEPFATADARADRRVTGPAARSAVISYVGVPVHTPDGDLWGTLCHFDVRPRLIPRRELPVLAWVARELLPSLVVIGGRR